MVVAVFIGGQGIFVIRGGLCRLARRVHLVTDGYGVTHSSVGNARLLMLWEPEVQIMFHPGWLGSQQSTIAGPLQHIRRWHRRLR